MAKTIFDYDSSGDEDAKQVEKDMYAYGTAILNHPSISDAYKAGKAALFKATAEHAKAITVALTRGAAGIEEFFLRLGNPLFVSDEITNARTLYEKLLKFQEEHKEEGHKGFVDTYNFKCFMVLRDFLANPAELVEADLQDAWGIRKGQVQPFLDKVQLIAGVTEEINKLLEFKATLPGLARDKLLAIIFSEAMRA